MGWVEKINNVMAEEMSSCIYILLLKVFIAIAKTLMIGHTMKGSFSYIV